MNTRRELSLPRQANCKVGVWSIFRPASQEPPVQSSTENIDLTPSGWTLQFSWMPRLIARARGVRTMRSWNLNRSASVAAGIAIGLVIGLNIAGLWPSIPLHAVATHGIDKFAIATGLVDDSVEALYFLDFLTGDLRAAVINQKTGTFNAFYTRNIAADFGGAGRNSGYLIVTGFADMPRGTANFQFSKSIVYVAEATTAQVAAYTIPWNSSKQAAGATQYGEFRLLDVKPFRTTFIRDEPVGKPER
jgi:hypothetical protein